MTGSSQVKQRRQWLLLACGSGFFGDQPLSANGCHRAKEIDFDRHFIARELQICNAISRNQSDSCRDSDPNKEKQDGIGHLKQPRKPK